MGVAPAGDAVAARGTGILRIANGRSAACWISVAGLALPQPIGAVCLPGQAAP